MIDAMASKVAKASNCLIAESDQFIAKLLLRYAEGSKLLCERARVGEDVVALARRINPDVIILDAEFPGEKVGWEMMRALKSAADTRHIALISCSWLSQAEVHSLAGDLTGYLQKPSITYGDFEKAIRAAGVFNDGSVSSSAFDQTSDITMNMMNNSPSPASQWPIELESKPDFDQAMDRIYAWYEQALIDRPPIRFTRHNAEYEAGDGVFKDNWHNLKDKWFDETYQIERFLKHMREQRYLGETFPIYWPNLGPNVFAALYGCHLEFSEVTSWAEPIKSDYEQAITLDWGSEYLKKLESLTRCALEVCAGQFIVGYTDLHPGLDWLAALRGTEALLMDLMDQPQKITPSIERCTADFLQVFDYFDAILKENGQPSVSWMCIPSFGKLHIPSCDFATMISPKHFNEFAMPALEDEARHMTHNIFHVDGKGVARHLDAILQLPNLQAIQWVQGVGEDLPIMQWVDLIRRVQAAGKSVVVDLGPAELEDFIDVVAPEGIFLTMACENEEEEQKVLKRIAKW